MATANANDRTVANQLPEVVPPRIGVLVVAVVIFAVAIGLQFGLGLLFGLVIGLASVLTENAGLIEQFLRHTWVVGILTYGIWVGIAGLATWWLNLSVDLEVPGFRKIGWILAGFLVAVVLALLADFGLQFLGYESVLSEQEPPMVVLAGMIAVLLLAGPVEEFLFRGVIQGTLRQELSAPVAILGASLMFTPLHVFNGIAANLEPVPILVYLGVVFCLSVILGGMYDHFQDLSVPIAIHVCYNAVVATLIYFPVLS